MAIRQVARSATVVVAVILGLLGIAQMWWFPTGALVFGVLAVSAGLVGRRLAAPGAALGTVLGATAVAGSILVVVITLFPNLKQGGSSHPASAHL